MALTRLNNQALTSVTAAGLPTLTSSNMPTGSIVQTVQTTASSEWYNSSAATFEDVTGQSIQLRPLVLQIKFNHFECLGYYL